MVKAIPQESSDLASKVDPKEAVPQEPSGLDEAGMLYIMAGAFILLSELPDELVESAGVGGKQEVLEHFKGEFIKQLQAVEQMVEKLEAESPTKPANEA